MRIVNFSVESNEIQIIPLADFHIGSPQADIERIKAVTDYIANTPNCYTILNGDLVDNAIRNSRGSVFEATMSPRDQVTTAVFYLQEIAKKGKIINMIAGGNHELRSEKESGLSPSDLILAHLMNYDETLNERYCEDGAYTFLTLIGRKNNKSGTVPKCTFTIFNLHGSGAGRGIGAKINRLDSMGNIVPANLYITAHNHQVETHRGVMFDVNTNAKTVREQPCVFVSCNSYLKFGGYGERAGMKPLSRAIPVITLKAKRVFRGNEDYITKVVECTLKENLED